MIIAFAAETILWKRNKLSTLDALFANAFWRFVFVVLAFFLLWPIMGTDEMFYRVGWETVGWAFAIQIFGAGAIIAWAQTMKNMAVSLAQPLSLFRTIPITLASFLIFRGELSIWQILLVIAISVFCFSLGYFQGRQEIKSTKDGNYKKGVLFLLLWIFCFSSIDIMVQAAARTGANPITFSAIRVFAFFLTSALIYIILRRRHLREGFSNVFKKDRNMKYIGIMFAVSSLLFIVLLAGMPAINLPRMENAGVLSALVVASVPLVVLYGVIFNKDRIKWYSFVLMALVIFSVIALTMFTTGVWG